LPSFLLRPRALAPAFTLRSSRTSTRTTSRS
jgi:hypothetical protein